MRRPSIAALLIAALFGVLCFAGVAGADTVGAITFESTQAYSPGDINNQNGWTKTGPYDVNVVSSADYPLISTYGFGTQALQASDSYTTGAFGDQTFAPSLADPSSETANKNFDAFFSIGTASISPNDGSHISISPDNGQGARMSYLRFEYHASDNMVHVFFDDSTQSSPCTPAGCAAFRDIDIAQFAPGTVHTFQFAITLNPGVAPSGGPNDVVKIYEDGSTTPRITGTTWEGYYRYDPESGPTSPPPISTLLFREAGTANAADQGNGFLLDNVAMSSAPKCTPTGFYRDGINLTAAQIGGSVTGTLDASGCNIGAYFDASHPGSVSDADISGANYYGVVNNAGSLNVSNSSIHDIGETQPNGSQHGVGVIYTTLNGTTSCNACVTSGPHATGTLSGNSITKYQKNGVVISGTGAAVTAQSNTVTGYGMINYIAQNGIEVASGASASITGNTVSGNWYTPKSYVACGLLFIQAGGVKQSANNLFNNEVNLCNAGRGGGSFNP